MRPNQLRGGRRRPPAERALDREARCRGSRPRSTNVHAAPCQSPPSSIVSIRLRYVIRRALAVAAERDVEVVAQPARQRHVPAPPEVLERDGGVRRVEVLRELEAEQQRDADRDVRVAAEVGEDLDGVAVDADQHLERRVRGSARRTPRRRCAVARWFAITTFRKSPLTIRKNARETSTRRGSRGDSSCGSSSLARTIGPATRCGKNAWKTAKRANEAGTSSPRYVSTTYEIAMNV